MEGQRVTEEILFIGGFMDGKRIHLIKNLPRWVSPFKPGKLVERIMIEDYIKVQDEIYAWNRMRIFTGATSSSVMVYQGITSAEVVERLIKGYAGECP